MALPAGPSAAAMTRSSSDGEEYNVPTAHLCVTAAEAARIKRTNCVSSGLFEFRPNTGVFRLFESPSAAIQGVQTMKGEQQTRMATEVTEWFQLELQLTEKQWRQLFMPACAMGPKLEVVEAENVKYMRLRGELRLENVSLLWSRFSLDPMGLDQWADKQL